MLKCSKCRKLMELKDGTKVSGLKIAIDFGEEISKEMRSLFVKSLGDYAAYLFEEDGRIRFEVQLCFECWLNSLFGEDKVNLVVEHAERTKK